MNYEFTAITKQHPDINGAYVEVPFDVKEIFGAKRVKVVATFDGYQYRGSIVTMNGCYMIGLTKQIREEINKGFGDTVFVTVEKDEAERVVELTEDFTIALERNDSAKSFWKQLSYSNQKKYANWIFSAKQADTRANRIEKAVSMLAENIKIK